MALGPEPQWPSTDTGSGQVQGNASEIQGAEIKLNLLNKFKIVWYFSKIRNQEGRNKIIFDKA